MNELNEWKNFNLKELFKWKDQNFTLLKYIWMLNKYKYLNLVTVNVMSLKKIDLQNNCFVSCCYKKKYCLQHVV